MKTLLLTLLFTTFAHASEWYDLQMGKMDNLSHLSVPEQIEILGSIVRIGRRDTLNDEHKAVLSRSRSMLIAIPGHAEYYEKKIKDGMAWIKAQPDDERPRRTFNARIEIFQILGQIPSPETVRVLGDFLADTRGGLDYIKKGDPMPTADEIMDQPVRNSNQAAMALYDLIDNPLTPYRGHFLENVDVPEWRLWYNQVKAGTRPIRFKGDPQEYNLNGPVNTTKTSDVRRPHRRDIADSSAEAKKAKESKAPTIPAIIAALLIGGGCWAYRRKQKA